MRSTLRGTVVLVSLAVTAAALAQPPGTAQPPNLAPPREAPKPKDISSGAIVGGKNLAEWIQDLKDKDPSTRENALATLKLYGGVAREAAPLIINLLKDRDVSVRVNATIALGLIGMDEKDQKDGIAGLIRLLGDGQLLIRYQAAMALGRLGTDAKEAIPALIPLVRQDSYASGGCWEVRKAAVYALSSVAAERNNPDSRAIVALIGAFNDVSAQVRLEAVIGQILLGPGTTGKEKLMVERALLPLTKDRSKHVQIWAHMALMRMDKVSETHLVAIAKHLKAPEATVHSHVGRALGTVGSEAKSRVPELIDAIQSEDDPQALLWLVWGLARIQYGDPAPRAVDALKKLLEHKLEPIRMAAAEALEMLKGKMRDEKSLPSK